MGLELAGDAPVQWSEWTEAHYEWIESRVAFTPAKPAVRVIVEVAADEPSSGATYRVYVDDVAVQPEE